MAANFALVVFCFYLGCVAVYNSFGVERQITRGPGGRILTNTGVWSPDGLWIVYDTRNDAAGDRFDGRTIEMVQVATGEVRELYRSVNAAYCGVATFHPKEPKVVFILGPENPTPDWQYCAWHRRGVIVDARQPGVALNMDARDIVPPFTPGALRGGSHVHVWDPDGDWLSFTYEDHVLAQFTNTAAGKELNLRNVGISVPQAVRVPRAHPRNHDGNYFSFLVTRTEANPAPGVDGIRRAFEEAWIGTNGYARRDGSRQRKALAFQGQVIGPDGKDFAEVFIVDLPDPPELSQDTSALAGTAVTMPRPPGGITQRRLTRTSHRKHPGLQGPRHWLRSSPDGSRIAFLMRDDNGTVQLWTISPNGGMPVQVTQNASDIASAFTWNPEGTLIAHVMDAAVCVTLVTSGSTHRLTAPTPITPPRPEACVFSPDGRQIAFVRTMDGVNQIFTVSVPSSF